MKRQLLVTKDGSHTLVLPHNGLTYHSVHGAITESEHVFVQAGLAYVFSKFRAKEKECINVFEMGFGTGLNALLTVQKSAKENIPIFY
ncbi:MAG: SAM-dependent methyltransferase, partial [Bacteroidota bacterium]|nr:SAM-dependent methyltransferase [Bacteroidota bacterium]